MDKLVKTESEIQAMRESGRILATILKKLEQAAVPGVSTYELDIIAAHELKKLGGKPAFLGYQGFPSVLCVSVNDEVVHGIPGSKRVLREGDIVGLDFGVIYKGMITDSALTTIAGRPLQIQHQRLVSGTKQALDTGISVVKNGVHTGDIGAAIQGVLDDKRFGIVRDLVGHGVGHELHEEPNVPNFGSKGSGPTLKTGMTIAIEPMATLGTDEVYIAEDGWTVLTRDGSLSAHFEHTVLVTQDGAEILTLT